MKKYGFSVFLLAMTLTFCKKQSTDEANKLDIITGGIWRETEHVVDNITGSTNVYSTYPDCRKDDYRQFRKDGIAEINEGPSKCNSADPQSGFVHWKFLNNAGSVIEIAGVEFIVDRLDDHNFRIHTPRTDPYATQTLITYSR